MGPLTELGVKSASKPGRHGDGQTLCLHVGPGGSKSWFQRVMIHSKSHNIGLGGYPAVLLEMMCRRAAVNRTAITEGRDPHEWQSRTSGSFVGPRHSGTVPSSRTGRSFRIGVHIASAKMQ
jgi:hypothetical protein